MFRLQCWDFSSLKVYKFPLNLFSILSFRLFFVHTEGFPATKAESKKMLSQYPSPVERGRNHPVGKAKQQRATEDKCEKGGRGIF